MLARPSTPGSNADQAPTGVVSTDCRGAVSGVSAWRVDRRAPVRSRHGEIVPFLPPTPSDSVISGAGHQTGCTYMLAGSYQARDAGQAASSSAPSHLQGQLHSRPRQTSRLYSTGRRMNDDRALPETDLLLSARQQPARHRSRRLWVSKPSPGSLPSTGPSCSPAAAANPPTQRC